MSILITSKENNKLKYIKSLKKSRKRLKESKFVLEGYRILKLAEESDSHIAFVLINESFESKTEHQELLNKLTRKNIEIYKTSDKIFKDLVDTENTQGVLAVSEFRLSDNIELSKNIDFILVLDRIQDPGNMGTIIRTADAAGIKNIILIKGCVDIYNPKVIRSTMGSIFNINIKYYSKNETLNLLKKHGFKIVSSCLKTENYYDKVDYGKNVALVIGNEANGISSDIVENSDLLVKVPMYGKVDSLNAAISSAILMYEIKKRLID